MLLTSDASLRLYDLLGPSPDTERMRLPAVVAAAPPVSFAFGAAPGWDALAVYLLCADGALHVACPIAPIGTRLVRPVWARMRAAVVRALRGEGDAPPADPFAPPPARRALQFDDRSDAWGARQAAMQLRFLDTVFARVGDGAMMVATREFKPAPVLFQGPLFTEHDDLVEGVAPPLFAHLLVLRAGQARPPVLLRVSVAGEVSVLLGLEGVEAQWYLAHDGAGDAPLEASEEYAEAARVVAPLLLCFEHLSFGEPVVLRRVSAGAHADVLYAHTGCAVYAVRLSFLPALGDPATLESTPRSSVSQLLSGQGGPGRGMQLHGLAPWFARGAGPVALVVGCDGGLHASDPLRWITDFDSAWPGRLLGATPVSDASWGLQRPLSGARAFAAAGCGKETVGLFRAAQGLLAQHGAVVNGTLGKVGDGGIGKEVLEVLEERVEGFTGGKESAGIGDTLRAIADALIGWAEELRIRVGADGRGVEELQGVLEEVERGTVKVRRRVGEMEARGIGLERRIFEVGERVRREGSGLNVAEAERLRRLREKRRRLEGLKGRIEELRAAVEANSRRKGNVIGAGKKKRWSAGLAGDTRGRWGEGSEEIVDFSRKEMEEIGFVLDKHSRSIEEAIELSSKVWNNLSASDS